MNAVWEICPVQFLGDTEPHCGLRGRVRSGLCCIVDTRGNADLLRELLLVLAKEGCSLFAFVGESSELAHDELDDALGRSGLEEIATTWHEAWDPEDVGGVLYGMSRAQDMSILIVGSRAGKWAKQLAVTLKGIDPGLRIWVHNDR